MKVGTPGFIGARLREAREARGLTAIALADLLGVSRQAVSQYESGDGSPSPEVMRRISEILDLPIRFFLEKRRVRVHGPIFYRSMSSATKTARIRAQRRYDWLGEIVDFLRSYVKFPAVKVPDLRPPSDPAAIGPDMIRDFAHQTRREWGLGSGPISNVCWLLENCGVVVSRYALGADELDAFSEWGREDSTPYVILNSEKQSAARSRFDVGHELGHLILHRNIDPKMINKPDMFKLIEDQAHRFCGEFLLPDDSFPADFYAPSLDSYRSMQSKWKVSIAFMIKRSFDLGLIDAAQQTVLFRNRSRRGWSTREPLDDQMEPELPRLLRRSVEVLVSKGIVAAHEIPYRLCYPPKDIEALVSLPQGYFDRSSHEIEMSEVVNPTRIIRFPGADNATG